MISQILVVWEEKTYGRGKTHHLLPDQMVMITSMCVGTWEA